jgi:hypothetical protein
VLSISKVFKVSERVHLVVVVAASIIENDITPNFAFLTHDSVSHEFAFALFFAFWQPRT